jgi:hypothetical protein
VKVGDAIAGLIGNELAYSLDCGESATEFGKMDMRISIFGYEKTIVEYSKNKVRNLGSRNNRKKGDARNASEVFNKVVTGLPEIFVSGGGTLLAVEQFQSTIFHGLLRHGVKS